jgi:hypothetical protein
MAVSEHQLVFDFAALERLVEQLREYRRVETGPARLLRELVVVGLAPDAILSAAALVLVLDEPKETT